jgi:hypothetical protein
MYQILAGKPEWKRVGRPRRRWWIILKWILRKLSRSVWLRVKERRGSYLVTCSEHSSFIKDGGFLKYLSD